MTIHRRDALKQLLFVCAGASLLPACVQDTGKASILLKNVTVTERQEKMLAELSETLIPATKTPGAKDISAHLFVLKMVDDCSSKQDQQQFLKGMDAFNDLCKKQYGNDFTSCTVDKRQALLQEMEKTKESKTDASLFYSTVKRLTIQAYTSSKFFLTNISGYKLVPGQYHGCVPVKA